MARSTAAEITLRVDAIYDLLLQGVGRRGIGQYADQHGWGVSARQIDTYIGRAKRLLAAQAERDRDLELGKALGQLDLLFMKALAAEDRAEARVVLHERTELLGLAAAQRHELSGPGGRPLGDGIAERAAAFLAGIESQAASVQQQERGEGE
jgi:hypothetical protein